MSFIYTLDLGPALCMSTAAVIEQRRDWLKRVTSYVKSRPPKPIYNKLVLDAQCSLHEALSLAYHCIRES